ncbi:PilW family protein [Paraburkholderia bonniea]|uniref:PilW family protein n=1 Tax=Paraburkholderia bonniea TaxID=2152891 RepID=UPI00129290D7|nr:PilW family protein [Paraburkholderia bonniea]WJF90846.1 PilW family protein [Paraburkholderia bonniea]WJF94160.1 PilW family protein [Paraburkholderia bonniea]
MRPRFAVHFVRRHARFCTRGHTLLELLIALALGLVVTAGAVSLYQSQRNAFQRAGDALQMNEAGRAALTLIGQQIQMAGFTFADLPRDQRPAQPLPAVFGCSGARPAGSGAGGKFTCSPLASQSDGILIRYFDDGLATWRSAAGLATDCLGQGVNSVSPMGAAITNLYYARMSGSTGQPELYCEGSGKPGSAQPVVEGVERLLVRYWSEGAVQALAAHMLTPEQWRHVVAVDVCVLVRGGVQPQAAPYVDCEGVTGVSSDSRMRRAFWRHVALRNVQGGALR